MDTNEMDIDIDLDFDLGDDLVLPAQTPQDATTLMVDHTTGDADGDQEMPAAYFESLDTFAPVPEYVNLQGECIKDWGPEDPTAYADEHCPIVRCTKVRWVDDISFNLEYPTAEDAALALSAFSQDGDQAEGLDAQTSRPAKAYSKTPYDTLIVRQANTGDRKKKDGSRQNQPYKKNNQMRPRGKVRRPEYDEPQPKPIFLDYGEDDSGPKDSRRSSDSSSHSYILPRGSRFDTAVIHKGPRNTRDVRNVDRYIPAGDREPRFGRLRGRSASPAASEDGRLGFADDGANLRQRYRSRSREAPRRRHPSIERSYNYRRSPTIELENNRWKKDPSVAAGGEPVIYHKERSIFDRMTKNGKPLSGPKPSLMSRITRDDQPRESNYGRLKDDWTDPQESLVEVAPKSSSLLSRITRDDDELNIRGASNRDNGINIRGASGGGFSIRGVAGGK